MRVQDAFPVCSADGVRNGHACRATHLRPVADAMNWLNGHGQHLVPATRTDGKTTIAIGATKTHRMQLMSRVQATHRVWFISARAGILTFTDPSGGASSWGYVGAPVTLRHVEAVGTPADGPVAVSYTLANSVSSSVSAIIDGVACFELQRRDLALDATDDAVDGDTVVTLSGGVPAPILDADAYTSIGALSRGLANVRTQDNRTLFERSAPSGDGFQTTSGSFVPLFEEGPVLLGSKVYRSSVTASAVAQFFVRTGAATTGEVRVTMTSGATVTGTIATATGGAWLAVSFDVDCEDLAATDGRRSSRDDVCTIEVRRTAGVNAVSIETVSVYEVRS